MASPAIALANKITIDEGKNFTYVTNCNFFPKYNLICFFIRHNPKGGYSYSEKGAPE